MLEFIQLLKQRYQIILAQGQNAHETSAYQARIDQLLLAEAFIRKGQLIDSAAKQILHIAVVGPTQAGKSSIVNAFLGSNAAGVSPLAGYTVHPQGFCHQLRRADCHDVQRYFGRFECLNQNELSKARHDCYSLTDVDVNSALLPPCIVWDTPDFDAIGSDTYREGVIRSVALADMVVLVVSKEKYADQAVWEMMAQLADLQQPTLICLNKISVGSEALLIPSLKEKWQQARTDTFPEVVALPYEKALGSPLWPAAKQDLIFNTAKTIARTKHSRYEQDLLQKYWQQWLAPVMEEHQAAADWQAIINGQIEAALVTYKNEYLDHPQHYETLQQTLAELLTLLEIPGLAGALAGTRRVLTWPVRQFMKMGRKQSHIAESSHELTLLNALAGHVLIQLADKLLSKTEEHSQLAWWKELSGVLRGQKQAILLDFTLAAKNYHIGFQNEVEKTALHLHDKLKEQPLVLNSLRATRVTADAAAIALTLHTGGIGVHDLVIAPAMLTVTSLLAESAVGSYLHKVEATLKEKQLKEVKQQLFMDNLTKKLTVLPEERTAASKHFNISAEEVQVAQLQLTEKRHGLRLL
jgi:hypothetical protein